MTLCPRSTRMFFLLSFRRRFLSDQKQSGAKATQCAIGSRSMFVLHVKFADDLVMLVTKIQITECYRCQIDLARLTESTDRQTRQDQIAVR